MKYLKPILLLIICGSLVYLTATVAESHRQLEQRVTQLETDNAQHKRDISSIMHTQGYQLWHERVVREQGED
jgi:hypothetical protein